MSLLLFWIGEAGAGPSFLVAYLDDEETHGMLRKNVASQAVGCQLVNASDGTAFTGAASVAVTLDNGVQGAGGGIAPAHEGNGYHSYTPTQAETNGNHIAFTFTGTGAVPRTVQVYTVSYDPHDIADLGLSALTGHVPQTGDAFVRLGAPAGASVSADILVIDNFVDGLEATVGAAGAGLTALGDTRIANLNATVSSRSTYAGGAVASVIGAVGSIGAGGITAPSFGVGAMDAVALAADAANEIADAALDRVDSIETGLTTRGALRLISAVLAGKAQGLETATAVFRNAVADLKARVTATVDVDGNRTAVTTDVS